MVRAARLAGLPIAYAGRRAAGMGKRVLGRPAADVDLEIQLRTAQHIFEVLGELKGCAAKLGQIMAVYELALPPELAEPYRAALSRLHDAAPPMLPATVHTAMAASMGDDWRELFREFDDRRAASATIGQVHRAVWHDGRGVAVKVMYPGARAALLADLDQLRRMSTLATVFAPHADVRALADQLAESVRAELDFAAEAEFQRTFAAAYANDPDFRVPEVVAQRGDVLITEWLDGIPLHRIIESGAAEERSRAGMLALRFVLSAGPRAGLIYCDPHPGNFRILPDGRLGVVDFGACAPWPPPDFEAMVSDLGDAVFNGGPAELDTAIRQHGFADDEVSFDAAVLSDQLAPYVDLVRLESARVDREWLRRRVLHTMNPRLSNVWRQLTMPASCTPFARALVTLLGLLSQLDTAGPMREEILRWSPELTAAFTRYRTRGPEPAAADPHAPADLAAARERRAARTAAAARPRRFGVSRG
ncbi:ABC1 kinase family protein [Nocardia sp. NPDC127526]|uniref:ABC1 kinase family protein n=1 Tax=Nocardia sp. NPDC127526 TaxID=3345393 RepID=UPI0036356D2F